MVWIKSGIAIHKIVNGFAIITAPLNEKSKINVNSSAVIVIGVRRYKNFCSNHSCPLLEIIHFLDTYPAKRGSAT